MKQFIGTGVAIVTPFEKNNQVDYNALEKLVKDIIGGGVDYLVVLGTTGESATLNREEKLSVPEFVAEVSGGSVPLVLGVGGNSTHEVIKQIKSRKFAGIDGLLSVAPYYNKPNPNGLYEHYRSISAASPVPIILYNVPGRTGVNIPAEVTLKLAHDFSNIVAIKEASGYLEQITKILIGKPKEFQVISGDDSLILPIIALGGVGVISVLANAFPEEISKTVTLALNNKFDEARSIYYNFSHLIPLMFADGNPAGIKAALYVQHKINNVLRLPLTPVGEEVYQKIEEFVGNLLQAH